MMVAAAQIMPHQNKVLRGPKRSPTQPPTHLEQEIGIGEGREYQPELRVAQAELFSGFSLGRRADVDPGPT